MEIMAIVNEEDDGLLATAHHPNQSAFALFRFDREIPVLVRRQIVIQRQFQRVEIDALHAKGQRVRHGELAFVPELIEKTPQEHRFATAGDPRQRDDPAFVDGDVEVLEDLPMMIGFKALGLIQTLTETKVLHDATEHRPILYIWERGDAGHGPKPRVLPRCQPATH